MKLLTWVMGTEFFGLFLEDIIEVVREVQYVRVPQSPPCILGLFNLRGEIITIIDLYQILFQKAIKEDVHSIIRIKTDHGNVGLTARSLHETYDINSDDLKPVPVNIKASQAQYIANVVYFDEKLILLLKLNKILIDSQEC